MLAREIIAAALLSLAVGCSSSPTGGKEGDPVAIFSSESGLGYMSSTLDFWRDEERRIIDGVVKRASSIQANFTFRNPDSTSTSTVSAGPVTVNGNVVPHYQVADGTWYFGSSLREPLTLPCDGSYQVFRVAGAAGHPGFVDSVRSPNGATSILSPMPTDTVSKSAGFTITWNADPTLNGVKVSIDDTCRQVGCTGFVKGMKGDPGSLTVTAAHLATLQPGPITITVMRGNQKFGEVKTGRRYRLLVYSSQTSYATLRP